MPENNAFERLYADPTTWRLDTDGVWFNFATRRQFRRWCDDHGGFNRWLTNALTLDVTEEFREDFILGYAENRRLNRFISEWSTAHSHDQ